MEGERGGRWALPFGRRPELELLSGRGSVEIISVAAADAASIEVLGGSDAGPEIRRVGNLVRVQVEGGDRDRRWARRRDLHVRLRVPRDVQAQVHAEAGSIEARDLGPGPLSLHTGAGRIAVFDVFGQISLSSGAGQIAGRGIGGTLRVETNAGAILLSISALDPGDHHISATAGMIRLELARDLDARVEIHPGRGSARTDFPRRQHAAAVLHVATDVGSIYVRTGYAERPLPHPGDDLPEASAPLPDDTHAASDPFPPTSSPGPGDVRSGGARYERILELIDAANLSPQDLQRLVEALGRGKEGTD